MDGGASAGMENTVAGGCGEARSREDDLDFSFEHVECGVSLRYHGALSNTHIAWSREDKSGTEIQIRESGKYSG